MADLTTSGTSMGNLSLEAALPLLGRVLPDVKTEYSAVVAANAEAGVGAATGARAVGAAAGAAGATAADPLIAWGCCRSSALMNNKWTPRRGVGAELGIVCTCMIVGSRTSSCDITA